MKNTLLAFVTLVIVSCVSVEQTPRVKPIGEVIVNNQGGQQLTQEDAKAIIQAFQAKYPTHKYSLINTSPGLISVMATDQAGQPTIVFAKKSAGLWTVR